MFRSRAAVVSVATVMLLLFMACAPRGLGHTTVVQNGITTIVSFSPDPPRPGPQAVNVTITNHNGHRVSDTFVEASVFGGTAPRQPTQGYEDDQGRYVIPLSTQPRRFVSRIRFLITAKNARATRHATVMTKV